MSEDHVVEWKESWRDDYLRWICGFANSDGGTLVIGRNDHGEPVGVEHAERLLAEIPNKVRDLLGIVVPVRLRVEQGHSLLEIVVDPYPTPINYRGEYHVRSGSTKQQLTGAALSAFLLRKLGRHWDGAPVPNVGAAELDPDAFRRFRAQAARSGRLGDESLLGNDVDLLDRLHLTEGRLLKRAALILFHAEPERFVSGASVKIGFFDSGAEVLYHDVIEGSLFRQVASTLDLLTTKYLRARISYEGVQRVETLPVPEPALRESLINALIHRDYSVPAPVQIRVYADRVSIWNPGHLPPSWTPDTLRQRHPSAPPNPDIANAFFRAGMIEAWGQGIEKVLAACRGRGLPEPLMHFDGVGLAVEFRFADPVTDPVTGPVTGPVTDPVLRLLLSLGSEALAPSVLQQRLGLKHRPTFRDNYLRPALAAGLIEMTVPERPQSRLQKYRLTAPGRARLSATRKP